MRVDLENYLHSTKEMLSEKKTSNYLKDLFSEEIEEDRKILIEGAEVPAEKTISIEPVPEKKIQEFQRILSQEREPEKIEPFEKKGIPRPTREALPSGDVRMKIGIILILLILGGVVSFYLLSDKTSTTPTTTAERRLAPSPAPVVSSPPVEVIVEQPKEKPGTREEKPKPPEKKPSTPGPTTSLPITKPSPPEEKPTKPSESRKPVTQAEAEVKPSPVERPEPVPKAEKEASLKGPEQRSSSLLGDLISHGPQLLIENRQVRILEQVQKLTPEEKQNVNVKVLECFAHLKKFVVDKDKQSKPLWGQLYEFLEKSNNRNATPLLVRITEDPDQYTRFYAVTLLGSIGDHRAIGHLQQIASSDPNRKTRRSAAKSIVLIQKRG
jgi:hypothetical protein